MFDDFKRVLARLQSDYAFYIDCQANPSVALAGYDLTPDERSTLLDPARLAGVLKGGVGANPLRVIFTISGRHDWVNRTRSQLSREDGCGDAVAREAAAVKRAGTDEERMEAAVRLMGLIG